MKDLANFTWPIFPLPALMAAAGVGIVTMLVVLVAHHYDTTHGFLTLSILIVIAFFTAAFASMIYDVPQTPSTEILIGGLATSMGAIIAYWMSARNKGD